MSFRFDTPLVSGGFHLGNRGLGVVGSLIPSGGDNGPSYIYNDLSLPADASKEYIGRIETAPSSGTFFAYEDGSFDYTGPSGSFVYRLFEDGVDKGTATVTLNVTENPSATVSWSEQSDSFSMTANVAGFVSVQNAWTEANDVSNISINQLIASSSSWSEVNDVFTVNASVLSNTAGILNWIEADDSVNLSATLPTTALVNWTEANDSSLTTIFVLGAATPLPSNIQIKFKARRFKITFRRD